VRGSSRCGSSNSLGIKVASNRKRSSIALADSLVASPSFSLILTVYAIGAGSAKVIGCGLAIGVGWAWKARAAAICSYLLLLANHLLHYAHGGHLPRTGLNTYAVHFLPYEYTLCVDLAMGWLCDWRCSSPSPVLVLRFSSPLHPLRDSLPRW
jgi:hypothetical protein